MESTVTTADTDMATLHAAPQASKGSRRHATPKSQETHRKILDAAVTCFIEVGYHRTTMSLIASEADVTRGCMQYYFQTTEDVLTAAADHLIQTLWGEYYAMVMKRPPGVERLVYAIDSYFALRHHRYFLAWMELTAASRTEPSLRPLIKKGVDAFERGRQRMSAEVFPPGTDYGAADYVAVADMVRLILEGLTLSPLGSKTEQRTRNVLDLVKRIAGEVWQKPL